MDHSSTRRIGPEPHSDVEAVPCVLFEDDHILVVNKPPGWNTHAPSPYAGEGIYDWLRHRAPRWSNLSIIHRLDKETSGILVFGKTRLANCSLTAQFEKRTVLKKYLFLSDRPGPQSALLVRTAIVREGARFLCRPVGDRTQFAETRFRSLGSVGRYNLVQAEPLTGKTHQVRVHAAHAGFPVLGDKLYGGAHAPRVCLHAASLTLHHPETGARLCFKSEPDWDTEPALALRMAMIDPNQTNAFRVIHGASDNYPGWFVDRLGDFLFSQKELPLSQTERRKLEVLATRFKCHGVYHQQLLKHTQFPGRSSPSPVLVAGYDAENRETRILENGVSYLLRFGTSGSVGLFLDQRDNRRRILRNHVAADFPLFERPSAEMNVLNLFAYTSAFSVCAASTGAHTASVDLSRKHLEWGRTNFELNGLDAGQHEFLVGDAFDWLRRLKRKQRKFNLVIIDPPTFSTSKTGGVFRVEHDFGRLVFETVPLIVDGGVLFASCNAVSYEPQRFVQDVLGAIRGSQAKCLKSHYAPQPPDFPTTSAQPAHLKSLWVRIGKSA